MIKFGFDLDGVLADFNTPYARLLTELSGVVFPTEDPNWPSEWDWERAAGVSRGNINKAWQIIESTHFWRSLGPTPECEESIDSINVMVKNGHKVCFITSRPGTFALEDSVEWLKDQGFEGEPDVFVRSSAAEKAYTAKALRLDSFVDDRPENCMEIALYVPNTFLLDRPWNRYWNERVDGVVRVTHPIVDLIGGK